MGVIGTLILTTTIAGIGGTGLGGLIGQQYARLKVGIGNDFPRGMQVEWVLGKYSDEDMQVLSPRIETACDIIKSFVLSGIGITMNLYNGNKKQTDKTKTE